MSINLKKEVIRDQIIVLVIPNEKYSKLIIDVAKFFGDEYKSLCYVSLNKLYDSLTNILKKNNINQDRILFIDGITKSANPNLKEADNCIYVDSSSALTEISIIIHNVLETGKFESFLFDSLSTLLIYNSSDAVCKFVHNLINKIKSSNTTAIFTALDGDTKSDLLKDISMFVDNVIHYE